MVFNTCPLILYNNSQLTILYFRYQESGLGNIFRAIQKINRFTTRQVAIFKYSQNKGKSILLFKLFNLFFCFTDFITVYSQSRNTNWEVCNFILHWISRVCNCSETSRPIVWNFCVYSVWQINVFPVQLLVLLLQDEILMVLIKITQLEKAKDL